MSKPRLGLCGHPLKHGRLYCSRSCALKATRARQTAERRREIAKAARASQRRDAWERFKARLRVLADTEEQRWLLAYRYGLQCKYVRHYRQRKASA